MFARTCELAVFVDDDDDESVEEKSQDEDQYLTDAYIDRLSEESECLKVFNEPCRPKAEENGEDDHDACVRLQAVGNEIELEQVEPVRIEVQQRTLPKWLAELAALVCQGHNSS